MQKHKLSAVLPLSIEEMGKSNSTDLADILLKSILKFAQHTFKTIFIICPSHQLEEITSSFAKYDGKLSIKVLDENKLVPELANYKNVEGWHKQQIIKLACASIVDTPFYVTFDADVICTHELKEESLVIDNKGVLQDESKEVHPNWWSSSAKILGMKIETSGPGMSVTPAILATEIVIKLIDHLSLKKNWVQRLLTPLRNSSFHRLDPKFDDKWRWTEYTLYYLFLEKLNLVTEYHVIIPPITLISRESVWVSNLDNWDDVSCFSDDDPSLFVVIQSNQNISPSVVWERVKKYLE